MTLDFLKDNITRKLDAILATSSDEGCLTIKDFLYIVRKKVNECVVSDKALELDAIAYSFIASIGHLRALCNKTREPFYYE